MTESTYMLTLADVTNLAPAYLETIFSLANGHMGLRAGDVLTSSATAGTVVNGFAETAPIQYGEMAYGYAENHQTTSALPDLRALTIETDAGERYVTNETVAKELNLANGTLREVWLAQTPSGRRLRLTLDSVLAQPAGDGVALTYTLEALDAPVQVQVTKGLALPQQRAESADPRQARQPQTVVLKMLAQTPQRLDAVVQTQHSHQAVPLSLTVDNGLTASYSLAPGAPVTFTSLATVGAVSTEPSVLVAPSHPDAASLHAQSAAYWRDFWQHSDVLIDGDVKLERALHYNLFQLTAAAGRDGKTNIAAKGLSGTGYEGHYFWDTEMYMLPFLTFTNPAVAKQLLMYRASILPQAKARARVLGVQSGALFAWRTINGEEASAYYPAGTAQYHIDGDIALAVDRYWQVTQDADFMQAQGLALMVETARFWAAFGAWHEGRFEFFTVTGPDEYTALVNNNYYTNHIAQFNLRRAAELAAQFPDAAAALGVSDEELASWQKAAAAVYLPFDEQLGINMQDDAAFAKPVWPFASTPKDHFPLLLHYHPLTIYRYQVNKQADTLLADYLFDDIDASQLAREYDYYERITTHDSSLSRSIFSALAARLGDLDKAYSYFMDTAQMDLVDLQGNAQDGLHIANLGGSWLSVATGFGGVAMKDGRLHVTNHLPAAWRGLTLRLTIADRLVEVTYRPEATAVTLLEGPPLDVVVDGHVQTISRDTNTIK